MTDTILIINYTDINVLIKDNNNLLFNLM